MINHSTTYNISMIISRMDAALVRIRYPESTVNSFLIKILNENNFGCLPSQSI